MPRKIDEREKRLEEIRKRLKEFERQHGEINVARKLECQMMSLFVIVMPADIKFLLEEIDRLKAEKNGTK
jgi:chromosome segregation ATPase